MMGTIKKFYLIGAVIVLAGLIFGISASSAYAAGCEKSDNNLSLVSAFQPLASFAQKIANDFGIETSFAATPDPDVCGEDTVGCNGDDGTAWATISWRPAPAVLSVLSFTGHYLTIGGVGSVAVGAATSFTAKLAPNTTYNWSVDATYELSAYGMSGTYWASLMGVPETELPSGSFTTPRNCCVAGYTDWSTCSATCSGGTQTRSYTDNFCNTTTETRNCNTQSCVYPLTVTKDGNGTGTVTVNGTNCGSSCTTSFPKDASVTLMATPSQGSVFAGWYGGTCSGTGSTCTISMTEAYTVKATFNLVPACIVPPFSPYVSSSWGLLSPTKVAPGGKYSMICNYPTRVPDTVIIKAHPGSGSCVNSGSCTDSLALNGCQNYDCIAGTAIGTFSNYCSLEDSSGKYCNSTNPIVNLTVGCEKTCTAWSPATCPVTCGGGTQTRTCTNEDCSTRTETQECNTGCCPLTFSSGSITPESVNPGGSYPMSCDYGKSDIAVIKATSGSGNCTFSGWDATEAIFNCTAGTTPGEFSNSCSIVDPSGEYCPQTNAIVSKLKVGCAVSYTSWTPTCPSCSNTPVPQTRTRTNADCTTAIETQNCDTPTCAPATFPLTVTKTGTGSGTVTGDNINCGSTCSASYTSGTTVGLMAKEASGSTFVGWSGACAPFGHDIFCDVWMTTARSVTAIFDVSGPDTFSLRVSKFGSGSGTVTADGINCGSDCTQNYNSGTSVTLTATPASGSVFAGWVEDCSGTGSCAFNMTGNHSVTATFNLAPLVTFPLTVTKTGTGSGTVTVNDVDSGSSFSASYPSGTTVDLMATAASGSTFAGWGAGACAPFGHYLFCDVWMTTARSVTAVFNLSGPDTFSLRVSKFGNGMGTVNSSSGGISCGSDCLADYDSGTSVTLTPNAAPGSVFAGWVEDCSGTGSCSLKMTANHSVTAIFNLAAPSAITLTVTKTGTGSGKVIGGGINCGSTCSGSYTSGTSVVMAASSDTGSTFAGWGGACSGTGHCTVSMTASRSVIATFNASVAVGTVKLTIIKNGTGSGTVTTSPGGINCGSTCVANFPFGVPIMLYGAPAGGSVYAGYSCQVIDPYNKVCTVTFNATGCPAPVPVCISTLNVFKNGTGSGLVYSNPGGIYCGSDCSEGYDYGTGNTRVGLTAVPAAGSVFAGWTGDCYGTGACVVPMTAEYRNVTATFNSGTSANFILTVTKTGAGTGTVTSNPAGINCGSACTAQGNSGMLISLIATPATGSVFVGWSGDADCSDGNVALNANKTCIATFSSGNYSLTISKAGTGTGIVTSNPAGINCGSACSAIGNSGMLVSLVATSSPGSAFAGWSGDADCSDGNITLNANKTCTATFNLGGYSLTVIKAGTGSGTVTSSPVGINCGSECVKNYANNTVVGLAATAVGGSVFAGWSGDADCSDGNITINANKTCMATFNNTTQSVTLTAKPSSGNSPLTTLLTASITGNISSTINYSFWWNCNNSTTDVATAQSACGVLPTATAGTCSSSSVGYKCVGVNNISQQATHIYSPAGNYTAKVIAERGPASMSREARQNITVLSGNNAPSSTNLNVINPSTYCNAGPDLIILNWAFSDPNSGDSQSAYQVRVSKGAKVCDTTKINGDSSSVTAASINNLSGCANFITYDSTATPYNWQVMVWDQSGTPSVWANGSFQTPTYQYPTDVNFTWTPNKADMNKDIEFTATANCHDADNICNNWTWDFNNDGTLDATGQTVIHAFPTRDNHRVTLRVFDSANSCNISKTVTIEWKWPAWSEILP